MGVIHHNHVVMQTVDDIKDAADLRTKLSGLETLAKGAARWTVNSTRSVLVVVQNQSVTHHLILDDASLFSNVAGIEFAVVRNPVRAAPTEDITALHNHFHYSSPGTGALDVYTWNGVGKSGMQGFSGGISAGGFTLPSTGESLRPLVLPRLSQGESILITGNTSVPMALARVAVGLRFHYLGKSEA